MDFKVWVTESITASVRQEQANSNYSLVWTMLFWVTPLKTDGVLEHLLAGLNFMNNQLENIASNSNHLPVTPSVQGGAKGERTMARDRQVGKTQRSSAVSCEMQWSYREEHLVGLITVKYHGVCPVVGTVMVTQVERKVCLSIHNWCLRSWFSMNSMKAFISQPCKAYSRVDAHLSKLWLCSEN